MRGVPTFQQPFINKKVASTPEGLDAIFTGEGKMTGYSLKLTSLKVEAFAGAARYG